MRAFGLKLGVAIRLCHILVFATSIQQIQQIHLIRQRDLFSSVLPPWLPSSSSQCVTCPDIWSPSTELSVPLLVVKRNIWSKYLVPPRPSVSSSCPLPTGWYAVPLNMTHGGTKAGPVISQFVLLCNQSLTEGFSVTLFLLDKLNEILMFSQSFTFQHDSWRDHLGQNGDSNQRRKVLTCKGTRMCQF